MSMALSTKQRWNLLQAQPQFIYHVLFFCVWVFSFYTGMMGIDFRAHWDEHKLFKSIRNSIPQGRVLPGWYNYPSMIYDITVLSASPEILTTYLADRSAFREVMEEKFSGEELRVFTVRARTVFLAITSLSLLWTYLLVHVWTKKWSQALLSAAILASSWELAYHARWLAPDAILMQFGILTVLLAFVALRSTGRRRLMWLIAAAIAAGMACATKYFGGIFLIPVFLAAYQILKDADQERSSYLLWFFVLAVVFTLTFLIITPGALIDTAQMVIDIRYEMGHYQMGDEGYTVNAGWQHLSLLMVYLFGVFFSTRLWLSLLHSVFVLIALYSMIKDNWKRTETWVFLVVPLLFIPYMSQQRVMMVRNDLLLFPFLAVLCAWGVAATWNWNFFRSNTFARAVLAATIFSALLFNFSWLYAAGETISRKLTVDWTQKLDSYVLENKDTTFYLSPGVRSVIDTNGFPNVVRDPQQADKLIFVFSEVNFPVGNRPNVYDPIFGPYEINMDYYPSWMEDDRIMVMPMEDALPQKQFELIFEDRYQ